jgi:hypothetical protein
MSANERQEIAEAILNELHFRRYNEALANGCNEKEAMALADNCELLKDAQRLFEFHHDVAGRSEKVECGVSGSFYDRFQEIIYGDLSDSEALNALHKLDNDR